MPFVDESGKPVELSPEEQAQYFQQQQQPQSQPGSLVDESGKPVDPFSLSSSDLADLATKEKDKFDLISQFAARPDLQKDPATVAKVADAFHQLREQPWYQGLTVGGSLNNVGNVVAGLARFGGKVTTGTIKQLLSGTMGPEAGALAQEESRQELGEAAAATEQGMTGLVSGIAKTGEALARGLHLAKPLKDYDQTDKVNALFDALSRTQQAQQIASGQGALAQAVTGGVVPVRPEEVSKLTDPFSWEALGAGSKGLGAVTRAASSAIADLAPAAMTAKAAELASKIPSATEVAGKTITGISKAGAASARVLEKLAGPVGAIGSPLYALATQDPKLLAESLLFGSAAGERAAALAEKTAKGLETAADFGKQISSGEVKSAYAAAIRDAIEAAPRAAGQLATGVGFDLSQVAGADTPQERQSAVGLGTAFGLLGAANSVGRHVISGQIIGPRAFDVNTPVAGSGQFPALDAMHNEEFANLTPGQRARVNATRLFLSKANPNADLFVANPSDPDNTALTQALVRSGMDPETAQQYAQQNGVATRLNGRKVIVVKEPGAAPHEAFHGIEDVLGEALLRNVDPAMKAQYANQWEDFGRYYASRLLGSDAGPNWRDTILDKSGWGQASAAEKAYAQTAQQFSDEARQNGQPPPTEQQIKDAVAANGIDWRQQLSPEEQKAAADRYVSRELLAENFDAWFKHTGGKMEPGKQLPERVARILGNVMRFFGENPLAGRRSEALGVPLSPESIKEATFLGKQAAPTVEPAPVKGGIAAPVAGPAAQTTADTARRLAAEQPNVPLPGQNQTQREIAGAAAEAFANDSALHLQYSSAPDEPAASLGLGLKRQDRRSMIEAFRQMPDSARQLFGKLFFPKKFIKTKASGIQIQGWSPEVFAANAHRYGAFLGELAQKDPAKAAQLAKYEFGPNGLTEKGWRDLYADLQNFVANQRAGRTGAGEGLVVPRQVTEAGYFAPPTVGKAGEALPQGKADLINMLFGFRLPGTEGKATRAGGAAGVRLPQNIAGRLISEATQPGRVSEPVEPRGAFGGAAAEKQGVAGEPVTEVNPYRKALEQAAKENGVASPSMIESWQNLNLNRIKEAELAPEQPKFGANPLTLQAGFLPSNDPRGISSAAIKDPEGKIWESRLHIFAMGDYQRRHPDLSMDEVSKFPQGFVTNEGEFLTREQALERARETGQLKREPKEELHSTSVQYQPRREIQLEGPDGKKYRATFDGYQDMSVLGRGMVPQFTALEDLPGGPIKGSTTYKPSLEKAGYKVPTDLEAAPSAQMQPKNQTETPEFKPPENAARSDELRTKLEDEGFSIAINAKHGMFEFSVLAPDGSEASHLVAMYEDQGVFKLSSVETQPQYRKMGMAELGYRELGKFLQRRGITTLTGEAVSEIPIALRKKVFGNAAQLGKVTVEPEFGSEQAPLPATSVVSSISPHTQYQPKTFVVRHGSTEMNNADPDKDLIRGHINVPLDAKGRKEAEDTAKQIAAQGGVQHIITSDLDRTVDTAKAIQDANPGSTITEDSGLRPWNFGPTIEGHPTTEMLPKIAELTENPDKRPPGGETFNEFKDRFLEAYHRAQDNTQDVNSAIVTHYRGKKLLDAWRAAGTDNDAINRAVFESYDKSKKPGSVDVIDKRGEVIEKGGIDKAKLEQPAQFQAAKRRSRDDYKLPEGGPGLFQKAWIMPDGKPVQLGDKLHHDWLNDNPAIKKQYGIKGSDEDNRVEALQKGFARINYEKNTGTLTVEARATDWPKLRDSVKQFASVNLGKIDNMDVSLLDPKAKKTVAADGVQLHSYPTVEEKMEQLPFIGTGGGVTELSPQASSLGGQYLPSAEPRALRSAAVRDPETGQIFEAPFHAMAVQHALGLPGYKNVTPEALASFEHGFTTNEGEFLDRAESARRAAEMNQLQQDVGPTQLERKGGIGIEHLKNDVLTQMEANRKAVPNLVAQYLPPKKGYRGEYVDAAAIKWKPTGKIYTGYFHSHALENAFDAGVLPGIKSMEDLNGMSPAKFQQFENSFEDGFTTSAGRFINRVEAATLAKKAGQSARTSYDATPEGEPQLDAYDLQRPPPQFQASPKETIAAFKDEKTLPIALHSARYAIITANRESVGPASNPTNQLANDNLEKALIADGYHPEPVGGEYKGVDQGKSFLVPDMTPEDAIRYAKNYGQESVLGPEGLIYQNGEVNPAVPDDTVVGEAAKKRDGWSQVKGGPAFSMGLDFDKRVPLAQFAPQADLFGAAIPEEKAKGLSTLEKSKLTKEGLAQQYPEAVIPKKRDQSIPSDIVGSPLYKEAAKRGGEPAAVSAFADRLVDFAKQYQDRPAFKDGAAWYDHIAPAIKKAFGKTGQLFAELLAATSPGQTPDLNFRDALQAHDRIVAGDYDKKIEKYNQGLEMAEDEKKWKAWLGKHGTDLPATPTPETFLGQWINFHDLKLTKHNGKLFGHNSVPVLNVAARKWIADAGPKTSNFVKNLLGLGHEATIDLWADRTMRWAGYEGKKDRWRIMPENVQGVDDKDFDFAQKVFAETAKRLGMRPDQLQGALWFAEKQRWADNGWSPLNLGTYEPEFAKIPEYRARVAQEQQLTELGKKIKPLTGTQSELMVSPRKIL